MSSLAKSDLKGGRGKLAMAPLWMEEPAFPSSLIVWSVCQFCFLIIKSWICSLLQHFA